MVPRIKGPSKKVNREAREFVPLRVENTLANSIEANITDTEVSDSFRAVHNNVQRDLEVSGCNARVYACLLVGSRQQYLPGYTGILFRMHL